MQGCLFEEFRDEVAASDRLRRVKAMAAAMAAAAARRTVAARAAAGCLPLNTDRRFLAPATSHNPPGMRQGALELTAEATPEERFQEFRRRNPLVEQRLWGYCQELLARRVRRCGFSLLWERLRWDSLVLDGEEEFRLPNAHRSRYVRLLVREHPELEGIFTMRKIAGEE